MLRLRRVSIPRLHSLHMVRVQAQGRGRWWQMQRSLGRSRVSHSLSQNDVPCVHRKVSVFSAPALAIFVDIPGRYPLLSTIKGSILCLMPPSQKEVHLASWIENGPWLT